MDDLDRVALVAGVEEVDDEVDDVQGQPAEGEEQDDDSQHLDDADLGLLDDAPLRGDAGGVPVPDPPADQEVAADDEGQGKCVAEEEDGAQEELA